MRCASLGAVSPAAHVSHRAWMDYAAKKAGAQDGKRTCAKKIRRYDVGMKTPREILQYVGVDAAAAALGVSVIRVDRAQRDEKLPASWLDTLERLARRPLDRDAFAFKGTAP